MEINVAESRLSFQKLGGLYPRAEQVVIEKEIIKDITCYWVRKAGNDSREKIALYVHGGCFVLGSIESHGAMVSRLAAYLDIPFLFVEYSLAPEYPYPQAVNEIVSVYQYLQLQQPDSEIIAMGDSAGAALLVTAFVAIAAKRLRLPDCVVMLSPWLDLSCSGQSQISNAVNDPVLQKERLLQYAALYTGEVLSPLSADNPFNMLADIRFPPTLILVGSGEVLLDDSKEAYCKILQHQENVRLSIYEKQHHVWPFENYPSDASLTAFDEIKTFLLECGLNSVCANWVGGVEML